MSTAEKVAFAGIGLTLLVALLNLGWNVYIWIQSRSSAGAHKQEAGRRKALRALRGQLREFQALLIDSFSHGEPELSPTEAGEDTIHPLHLCALQCRFMANVPMNELREWLAPAERNQLSGHFDDLVAAVTAGEITRLRLGKIERKDLENAQDALGLVGEWALHLLQPASIDCYLAGVPVVWTGEEHGSQGD